MTRFGLTAPVLVACALLWSASANAETITINAQVVPSPVKTLASGPPPIVNYSGSTSPFDIITGSAAAVISAPGTTAFNTSAIGFSAVTGGGTLLVWITLDGLTAPATPTIAASSGFTANDIIGDISSVKMWTYLDPSNGIAPPVGSTLLGAAAFTHPSTSDVKTTAPTGSGPYSLQEVYEIVSTGPGNVNLTIDLNTAVKAPIPEPATLALVGTALLGIGLFRRRR